MTLSALALQGIPYSKKARVISEVPAPLTLPHNLSSKLE